MVVCDGALGVELTSRISGGRARPRIFLCARARKRSSASMMVLMLEQMIPWIGQECANVDVM